MSISRAPVEVASRAHDGELVERRAAVGLHLVLCSMSAAALTALPSLLRGSVAGAGLALILAMPATLVCVAALSLGGRVVPSSARSLARRLSRHVPRLCVFLGVLGVAARLTNFALAEAALQRRPLVAYVGCALLAGLASFWVGRSARFANFAAAPLAGPLTAAAAATALAIADSQFYPYTFTRLHVPLLALSLVMFSFAVVSWFDLRRSATRVERSTLPLVALALILTFSLSDKRHTYDAMLGSFTSQQRLLMAARSLIDRDGDSFSARLGGGDCNDRDASRYPLALSGRDCLGWGAQRHSVTEVPWADGERSEAAPRIIVLLTIDAFRCGFGRLEPAPELVNACPELTELGAQGRLRLDAHTTWPRTDEAMGSLNTGSFRYEPSEPSARFFADWMDRAGYDTRVIATTNNQLPGNVAKSYQHVDASLVSLGATRTRAEAVTSRVMATITAAPAERPLFIWAHYFESHAPYMDPPESMWAVGSDLDRYSAEVRRTDAAIGRLARELAASPFGEQVLLLVTADHGEEFGENGAQYHGFSLSEQAVRIPMLVWSPSRELLANTPPMLPVSIAEVSGYLTAVVTSTPFTTSGEAFFSARTPANRSFGIHRDGWKLIHHREFDVTELYYLPSDPLQRVNLVDSRPDMRDLLGGRLVAYIARSD